MEQNSDIKSNSKLVITLMIIASAIALLICLSIVFTNLF